MIAFTTLTSLKILSGIGSTFDGITLTNGYQPLWLTILVPVYKLVQFDLYTPLKIIISISSLIFLFQYLY